MPEENTVSSSLASCTTEIIAHPRINLLHTQLIPASLGPACLDCADSNDGKLTTSLVLLIKWLYS